VAYIALFPEIYQALEERTEVSIYRQVAAMIGSALAVAGTPLIVASLSGRFGSLGEWTGAGLILGLVGGGAFWISLLGSREREEFSTGEDLATTTWQDLVASAEEGLGRLQDQCEHVFVAGLSLGGLTTLYLAVHHSIIGAIVMAAPAYITDWRFRFLPLIKLFVKWRHSSGKLDLTDPNGRERVFFYRRIPVIFGQEVNHLLQEVRGSLGQVKVPVLIMQGRCDYEWGPLATSPPTAPRSSSTAWGQRIRHRLVAQFWPRHHRGQ